MKKGCEGLIKIAVINGANINLLGMREPQFYGNKTLHEIEKELEKIGQSELNVNLVFFQSNHEGEIVDFIQERYSELDGIIINPAAFSKTGYSILEAIIATKLPFVEVHLSNIFARGGWHGESIFLGSAVGQVVGFQDQVYELGLRALQYILKNN